MNVSFLTQEEIKKKFILITSASQLSDGTLGTSDKVICKTCPPSEALSSCLGHMGYIALRREIPHPLMVTKIYLKLMRYCWSCKKSARSTLDILTDDQLIENKEVIMKIYRPSCSFCNLPLKNVNVKWKSQEFCFEGILSAAKTTTSITTSEIPEDCRKYIIRYMPIMPPHLDRGSFGQQNLLRQYEAIMSPSADQFEIYSRVLGVSTKKMYGYSITKDVSGKHGVFEQEVVGKRLTMCGRSVITPNPTLDIDDVMVPAEIMNNLKTEDGDLVLLNRQPTLKKYSLLALRAVKNPNKDVKTIQFNPCLCKSYNADFDGDEMNIFVVPKTEASLRDADVMLPSKNIISDQNKRPIIYPHQDCQVVLKDDIKDEIMKNPSALLIVTRQKESYEALRAEEFSLTNFKNSLLRIISSGARGSMENYKQMFEEVGLQNLTKHTVSRGERYIDNSFEEGLSFENMFIHCQSSREGIVSVGVNTPSSGYLEKRMIRSMGNMIYDKGLHRIKKRIVSFEEF
jgi:DNA-directed RNA polymerase beta' subunit